MHNCKEKDGAEKRIRVEYGTDKSKKYPVIVRDFSQWTGVRNKVLADEMERAWRASLRQSPGATLESVENNDGQ